jgi:ubiquinone/menaquinone biosynthesis C-methylase UbiE
MGEGGRVEDAQSRSRPAGLSKIDARRTYARLSRVYDAWGLLTESAAVVRALRFAGIRDGECVLEVAAGTGRVFEQMVAANGSGKNVAIDLSKEMLAVAARRLRRKPASYSLAVADAYALPFADCSFDVVFNSYMFDLLPEADFVPVLFEFRRVLKPHGRVAITSMTPGRTWYSRTWDAMVGRFPNMLEGCRPVLLHSSAVQAGFQNLREEYVSQFTFPSLILYAEKPGR